MRLSEGITFKSYVNPQARDQNINQANLYENEMGLKNRDLNCSGASPNVKNASQKKTLCTSDFQSEVGEVFGEIGGELPAKFGRRFSSFFCWGKSSEAFPPKLHRKFHHQTSLRGSGIVAGPKKHSAFRDGVLL